MLLMLLLGYTYFTFILFIICLFGFLKLKRFFCVRNQRDQTSKLMRSLSRMRYSEELFGAISDENECIICLSPFTSEDLITKLDC
jgi:hypothetical protein